MIIYRSGTQVLDAPVTSAAVHKATLMKEDYIKLSFVDTVDYAFKAGDYVTVDGMNYSLNKDYIPTMRDEATYSYELQFNAPWYNLDSYIFFFNTYIIEDGVESITKRESDWYITDSAANILSLIIKNTRDQSRDCPCRFESVFFCEGTTVKTFTFSSTSILAALNNLAKEFELEWWVEVVDGLYYLHFGECDDSIVTDEVGSVIFNSDGSRQKGEIEQGRILTSGTNVSAPSISNKNDLKKKYFVYGSSRNIDQTVDMLSQQDGTYVSSLVTKRLAMDGNPQIPENTGFGEEVVIFDDIYPRSDWQITNVTSIDIKSDEIERYDEDDNPIYKKYKVYNVRLGAATYSNGTWTVTDPNSFSDYVFSLINDPNEDVQYIRDVIAPGKELSLKFIIKDVSGVTYTPVLAGFEFELGAFLDENIATDLRPKPFPNLSDSYQWYEFQITKQEVNGYVIPNDTLIPKVGDWVCLYNIKGKYIDANEQANAQTELSEAFNKYYKNLKKDVSYTVKPYVDTDLNLSVGNAVLLQYGQNEVRSRISSFEKKLDYSIDASYVISSYVQPSTVNQLKEEVKTITANIASGRAFQLDGDTINSMLDLYGSRKFLSKTKDDEADGIITFNKLVEVVSKIGTPTFTGGFTGSGWQIDNSATATFDDLVVRKTMRVFELLIQQVKSTGGEIIVSPANGRIKDIEEYEGYTGLPMSLPASLDGGSYVCTIENGADGDTRVFGNMFQMGDLVRCQRWDASLGTVHYYWVQVRGVSGDKIYLSKDDFDDAVPEIGDELVLMGSATNSNRRAVISITATDNGKPRVTVLNGIGSNASNPTSLEGCTRAVLGDLNDISDSVLNPSGYGLYSDNVFLKGKLAIADGSSYTEIGAGFIALRNGVTRAGINLDGENSTITLTAGKTNFVNDQGNQIASFTGDGLQSNVVACLDEDGNMRVRLDKDGLKMYYPNGQVMKEEVFVYDTDGNVSGTATCYYESDGTLKWMINTEGVLDKGEVDSYWTSEASYYLDQEDISSVVSTVAQGKNLSQQWSKSAGSYTNCTLSQYHTNSSGSTYDGVYTTATVAGNTPASTVPRLEGWIMSPLTATQDGNNYTRTFYFYHGGKRSTIGVPFNQNSSTQKVLVGVSYITFTFNLTTYAVTAYTAYDANDTVISPTTPTPFDEDP